jgi:hypothetical protein
MKERRSTLLIIDYNLSRVAEVAYMSDYARKQYDVETVLIRANPGDMDKPLCDYMIALDPRSPDFVDSAFQALLPWLDQLRGGIVFSDNAVHSGATLLERLGLKVDSAELALGAFSKLEYRRAEARCKSMMNAQRIMVPDCISVETIDELRDFAQTHVGGFVIKPSCEGNNRGVVMLRADDDLASALNEVTPYIEDGVICEEIIPYHREFSYDGVGGMSFVTEKVSASGRYPVEVAQVLPAFVSQNEEQTLLRAGAIANLLVGQRDGPFHNEIKLSDDGQHAAIVEPNRRPAGMKIWKLANAVFGVDFYRNWIDAVLGDGFELIVLEPSCQAASVMLGVQKDRWFAPDDVTPSVKLISEALALTINRHGLAETDIRVIEFGWLGQDRKFVPAIPRDNGDFIASVCISLHAVDVDIRDVVRSLREFWAEMLEKISPVPNLLAASNQGGAQTQICV